MSHTVRIGADLVPVEPGATVPVTFEIANRSDEADRFEVSVEGVDPEWVAVPVPTFQVEARDVHQEKVFFKPPRLSESRAGDYPFVINVRSLISGEARTVQGVLSVKSYHHLSMEISPKKGAISAVKKQNVFEVTVMNLGNTDHTVQLSGSDPEDLLTFDFEEDQIDLGPGQTKVVRVVPSPGSSRPFSSARLHGFQLTGRSLTASSVACSASAQLEERPVLSPGMLLLGFLAIVLFVGWWLLLPKPPSLDSLTLDTDKPTLGQVVRVRWKASNANSVEIRVNGQILVQGLELEGEKSFTATTSGEVSGFATRDNRQSSMQSRTFTVFTPPEAPTPEIRSFDISPKQIRLGEPFLVKYGVNEAVTKLTLAPSGISLDPKLSQIQVVADVEGNVTYELVAENSDGSKVARKSVKVRVVVASKAGIVVFKADNTKLPAEGGAVKLTWQVTNAARVELSQDNQPPETVDPQGERFFTLSQDAEFTLAAFDDQGNQVNKKVKVKLSPPTEPPPTTATTGGTAHVPPH